MAFLPLFILDFLVFLLIASAILCSISVIGLIVTIISVIRRTRAVKQGEKPHKAGLITGIILMIIPVLVVGGIVLTFAIDAGEISSGERASNYRDALESGIMDDDTEIIYMAFSEYTKERDADLRDEIYGMLTIIDGDVESFTQLWPTQYCEKYAKDGSFEIQHFEGKIRDIVTDAGKTYEIYYYGYSQYDGHEDRLGLERIVLSYNDEKMEIGIDTR